MKFPLQHVALYTKGWYDRSGEIWRDILKCLIADKYLDWNTPNAIITAGVKQDILSTIIRHVTPLFKKELKDFAHDLVFEIDPHTCWRYGYYHKGHTWIVNKNGYESLGEYDYQEATLWYFLSKIQGELLAELESLTTPDENVLPVGEERMKRFLLMKKTSTTKF